LLSPWRQPKPESKAVNTFLPPAPQVEIASEPPTRQISPQVAATVLSKPRPDSTARQAEILDVLKEQCPGFAVMRKLWFGFRSILSRGKVTNLHRWLEEARRTGIHSLERFVRTVKAGPQRGGIRGDGEVEQRAGGKADQSPEGAETADVWSSRRATTSCWSVATPSPGGHVNTCNKSEEEPF
jgi:hypothetical protein